MFVTKNQFYVFIACVAFGAIGGVVFSFFTPLKLSVKSQAIRILLDATAFIVFTGGYVFYSFTLNFPSIRAYNILGVLLGLVLYLKSFGIILAKSVKKLYNILRKKLTKVKNDGRKDQKTNSRRNGRRSSTRSDIVNGNGISAYLHWRRKR